MHASCPVINGLLLALRITVHHFVAYCWCAHSAEAKRCSTGHAAQCGGLGGSCAGADCVAGQIPGTCCLSGYGSDFYCREGNKYVALLQYSDLSVVVLARGAREANRNSE